jgi:hypothetical protein
MHLLEHPRPPAFFLARAATLKIKLFTAALAVEAVDPIAASTS